MHKNEFVVLTEIEKNSNILTQKEISKNTTLSLKIVNDVVSNLTKQGYISDMKITGAGYEALKPYLVERAIFFAAGLGTRMQPITLNTPKPLVSVNGKRIIEYLLEAVLEAGIKEIIIVRGYLSEKFDVLKEKYPNIKFVDNNFFKDTNNIYSAFLVREYIKNSYVLEADLMLKNKKLITKYQYSSNYLAIKKASTNDWCFYVDGDRITSMTLGGANCYQMVGISYWDNESGEKLVKDIEMVYNSPLGKEKYWDEVPMKYCLDNYKVEVRPCLQKDIVEIDTINELKAIDKTYDI